MRIILFGNGKVALDAVTALKGQGQDIAALVLHPPARRRLGDEIIAAAGLPLSQVFDASTLREEATIAALKEVQPDIGLSIFFGYILKRDVLDIFPRQCLNLHPALLPYNRGAHPNVWSIVEGTPAGVTLHYIDEGVDTGDVIAQQEVVVEPVDTGETLYRKLEETSLKLLMQVWPEIVSGHAIARPQPYRTGSVHRTKDVDAIDQIELDKQYKARDLINILRARTFSPYRGAYFVDNGRKVVMSIQLRYDDEATSS